jgi:putative aldouronate transport system substrate-binding protein
VKLVNDYIYVLDESIAAGGMTIDQVLPFNTNDMHHVTGPFKVEFAHYRDIQEVSTAVKTGVAKFSSGNGTLFYNEIRKYLDKKDLVGFGRWIQMGDAESSLVHALKHVDNKQLLFTKMWGVAPQELRQAGSTLDDLLLEGYTKIITGVEPIAYYDTLIQNWRKAGGDTVPAAVNKTYGKK